MKTRNGRKGGFTLIEVMVVILVILVLSGMLLKLSAIIRDRSETAKATANLQNIQHALNEYYAEYGIYPPVQSTAYVYEDASRQPPSMRNPNAPITADQIGYAYGLYAHLYPRAQGGSFIDGQGNSVPTQRLPYNEDTERDKRAKDRWAHYLADVGTQGGSQGAELPGMHQTYTNASITISDPWGSEFKYQSPSPHQEYTLWSCGPDGTSGTADDITN